MRIYTCYVPPGTVHFLLPDQLSVKMRFCALVMAAGTTHLWHSKSLSRYLFAGSNTLGITACHACLPDRQARFNFLFSWQQIHDPENEATRDSLFA